MFLSKCLYKKCIRINVLLSKSLLNLNKYFFIKVCLNSVPSEKNFIRTTVVLLHKRILNVWKVLWYCTTAGKISKAWISQYFLMLFFLFLTWFFQSVTSKSFIQVKKWKKYQTFSREKRTKCSIINWLWIHQKFDKLI
jgi:hypothetical protein